MGIFGNRRAVQPMRDQRITPPTQERSKRCKILTKKRADGSEIREISGDCTKDQLRALSNVKGIDGSEE